MRAVVVAYLATACGGAVAVPTPAASSTIEIAAPSLPRADFVVVPAELLDEGVLKRIPHRVRVRRMGMSWLAEDGKPHNNRTKKDVNVVLPVIDESAKKIRVVFEDDKARLALWIAREDAWSTVAMPIELSDRDGKANRDAGIWVKPGAPLEVAGRHGDRRHVTIRDPQLSLHGFVPEPVLVKVWIGEEGPPPTLDPNRDEPWTLPADKRTRVVFPVGTQIRSAPEPQAPALIVIESADVIGFVAAERGEYRHVEIARPFARIKGFVRTTEATVTSVGLGNTHTTGRGHGFGMSHASKIDVPRGTCLYDRINGEVIGVQSEDSTRLGHAKLTESPTWSAVYVGTNWETARVHLRSTSDDPTQPKWESCTQPVHRR